MASQHTCDSCHKPVTAGLTVIEVQSGALRDRYQRLEVCPECAEAVGAAMAPKPSTEAEELAAWLGKPIGGPGPADLADNGVDPRPAPRKPKGGPRKAG